jgi:hypothetical protein
VALSKRDEKRVALAKLTGKQIKAIALLLTGETISEVARILEVRINTVIKWQRRPDFHAAFSEEAQLYLDGCLATAKTRMGQAMDFLTERMNDGSAKNSDRIKAAGLLLSTALKSHEITVLKKELAELADLKILVKQITEGGDGAPGHGGVGATVPPGNREEVRSAGAPAGEGGGPKQQA